jgi:hypothetical protein
MRVFRAMLLLLASGTLAGSLAAQSSSPAATPPAQSPADAGAQDQNSTRDLKVIPKSGSTVAVSIPRSYAVVIGISSYKNLPASAQLEFPNRDAEDIYAALISPEGGQFPAENVHKLRARTGCPR